MLDITSYIVRDMVTNQASSCAPHDNCLGKLSTLLPRKLRGLSLLVGAKVEIPEKKDLVIADYGRLCRKPCRRLVENSMHAGEFRRRRNNTQCAQSAIPGSGKAMRGLKVSLLSHH
jgi:hypothetical protein